MKVARGVIVAALLPLAIAGALVLSATATMGLATSAGVTAQTAPAAVAMLEVVSLAGTLLWVLVANASLRRDAVLATLAASAVSLVAGFHAYGWFGAVAPCALVVTVHLASRAWREDWGSVDDTTTSAVEPVATVADLVATRALSTELSTESEEFTEQATPDVPGIDPGTVTAAAELLEREPAVGRPRMIAELEVTDHQARKLLAALRPMQVAS